jgi:hypothetical protein
MEGIRFDPTISLGTVVHLVILVATVVGMYVKLSNRIVQLETKIELMYAWWKAHIMAEDKERKNL